MKNGTRVNTDEHGFFDKSIKDLNEFFGIEWVKNLPELVVMGNEDVANEVFKNQFGKTRQPWQVGWVKDTEKVYVLDKEYIADIDSDEDYFGLIKHELVHSFTCFYCMKRRFNCQKLPKWIWEGLAIFLSDHPRQDDKLTRFLDSYSEYGEGLYQESGLAVRVLVEKFGKGKFFELVDGCGLVEDEDGFFDLFERVYGFRISYEEMNKLLGDLDE